MQTAIIAAPAPAPRAPGAPQADASAPAAKPFSLDDGPAARGPASGGAPPSGGAARVAREESQDGSEEETGEGGPARREAPTGRPKAPDERAVDAVELDAAPIGTAEASAPTAGFAVADAPATRGPTGAAGPLVTQDTMGGARSSHRPGAEPRAAGLTGGALKTLADAESLPPRGATSRAVPGAAATPDAASRIVAGPEGGGGVASPETPSDPAQQARAAPEAALPGARADRIGPVAPADAARAAAIPAQESRADAGRVDAARAGESVAVRPEAGGAAPRDERAAAKAEGAARARGEAAPAPAASAMQGAAGPGSMRPIAASRDGGRAADRGDMQERVEAFAPADGQRAAAAEASAPRTALGPAIAAGPAMEAGASPTQAAEAAPAGETAPAEADPIQASERGGASRAEGARAASAPTHGPPPAQIARQLAEAMPSRPGGPVELHLDPSELGRVRITLQSIDGALTALVVADRPETAELMRRHADLLESALREAGGRAVSVDVSGGGQGSGTASGAGSEGSAATTAVAGAEPVRPAIAPIARAGGRGLDIKL